MKMVFLLCMAISSTALTPLLGTAAETNSEELRFFETRIRPLLAEKCFACHGPEMQKANLRLDSAEGIARGGKSLKALIVTGKPDESHLIHALQGQQNAVRMPPSAKLADRQIADVIRWIKAGAPYPATTTIAKTPGKHWAFQPVTNPTPPPVKNAPWSRTSIDRFILAELEAKGLHPAPAADQRTLIRRVTFDLTGLPPTPHEIDQFLSDSRANPQSAWEKLVDRLLASPAYGEKWGRHWLDVVRYADSNGLDENIAHGNAWRYRDYVVAAFNGDKPYDQFLREQIAGDLLPQSMPDTAAASVRNERLIATGFLSLGPKVLAEPDEKKMEMDIVDEQIDTLGRSIMGLTLGCARCHDHKFDPLPTEDYYGLAGIFLSTRTMEHFKKIARWNENPIGTDTERAAKSEHDRLVTQLKADIKTATAADKKKLMEKLTTIEKNAPTFSTAMGVTEGTIVNAPVLPRGNHVTPGKLVPRRFPLVIAGTTQSPLPEKQSGRLELANWLTSKDHPLTARVMVNRVWRWHFGQGLVRSVDNFGLLGEKPSHPELLDWLARKFMDDGWSIKKLHREILLSAVYQQASSTSDRSGSTQDPDNRWLARFNPRRLQAEEIRDSLLLVSGQLDRAIGGPALTHVKNREFLFDHTSKDKTTYDSKRRSIYLPVIRNNLFDVFMLFDGTDATVISGDRTTTTVATQALFWMNSPLMREVSEKMTATVDNDTRKQLHKLYVLSYGREPTNPECERMERALTETKESLRDLEPDEKKRTARAWAWLGQTLLSANEFVYIR